MRLSETLSRDPLVSMFFLVLIMSAIFMGLYLLGSHYLSNEFIVVKGGNYPIPTNISGSVLVSMGPGEYKVKITSLNINNPHYKICCIQQDSSQNTCVEFSGEECSVSCNVGIIVYYYGVVPPHQIKIAGITVEKK
ncbi:MAG: hypothetical protein GSR79_00775 [Desulfurococcales archaeon]|nr:hypothetical protein [Desulfurococcales archaeon]